VRHILLQTMSTANPPTLKGIAGQKRKRGYGIPAPKSKVKRHHEESLRLQELEKKVAQLVEESSHSEAPNILTHILGGINDCTNLYRYAAFGGYQTRWVNIY
jgi:hypothetical protein